MSWPATAQLAHFTSQLQLDKLPAQVTDRAKLLVLDNLGVALAAAPLPIGRKISAYVESLGGEPAATMWGSGRRTAAPLVALANGTLSSALDYDAGWHLTTHTLPAAIAAGEQVGGSGLRVLEAFVAGYEAGARLIEALDSDRHEGAGMTARGWYHVGFVGPIASALAAGKALCLDEQQLCIAAGTAAAAAGGIRRNFGTMAKAYQAGNAANQGVQAALLAANGFGGDPEALEAPLGLFGALGVSSERQARALGKLGSAWELLASLKIKRFPACTPAHQPLQIALQLQRQHGFDAEDVETIEADLHAFSLLRLDPADEVAAGFSLPFLLAVALVDGELTLEQVRDERIHDPRVRQLMGRIRPTAQQQQTERVTVQLRDGRRLTGESSEVDRLDGAEEIAAKFRECAGRTLSAGAAERLRELVMRMETLADIAELAAATG